MGSEAHPFVFRAFHLNIFPAAPDKTEWQVRGGICHVRTRQHNEHSLQQNLVRQLFTRLARNFGGATSFRTAKYQNLGRNLVPKNSQL
jgi:hypothetical protein